MTNQPTADNASIENATVQIRTLTVNAKQMTLGVFRQLIEQPVINQASRIDGTPWGAVNYHLDKCEDAKEHLHVVWQLGDQLRRSFVLAPEFAYIEHRAAPLYAMALIAEGATQFDKASPLRVFQSTDGGAVARFNLWGVSFRASIPMCFRNFWQSGRSDLGTLQAAARERYGAELLPSREVAEQLPVGAYKASWRALKELPQLFIGR